MDGGLVLSAKNLCLSFERESYVNAVCYIFNYGRKIIKIYNEPLNDTDVDFRFNVDYTKQLLNFNVVIDKICIGFFHDHFPYLLFKSEK
tara:strand:- start:58 stop:324 length:267 start_codon:yes stop_codon:yes gene_type:complete